MENGSNRRHEGYLEALSPFEMLFALWMKIRRVRNFQSHGTISSDMDKHSNIDIVSGETGGLIPLQWRSGDPVKECMYPTCARFVADVLMPCRTNCIQSLTSRPKNHTRSRISFRGLTRFRSRNRT